MATYSHPVLRSDTDDIVGTASYTQPEVTKDKLLINEISIENDEFKKLIHNNHAALLVYIENNNSFFSRTIHSNEYTLNIDIDSTTFPEGEYSMELTVIANKDINDFSLESFHSDFGNTKFQSKKGDIRA